MLRDLLARFRANPNAALAPALGFALVMFGIRVLQDRATKLYDDAEFFEGRLRSLVPVYQETQAAYVALRNAIEDGPDAVDRADVPTDETLEQLSERIEGALDPTAVKAAGWVTG